jgi:hypothetical protein
MTNKITKRKALELLDKAVEAKGTEHTTSTCTYFDEQTGAPNCIVGYGFNSLGITLPDLIGEAAANGTEIVNLNVEGYKFTRKARRVLSIAQTLQDEGSTWGEARDKARVGKLDMDETDE